MNRLVPTATLIVFIALIPTLSANADERLTIDEAVAMAIEHHPIVAVSQRQHEASQLSLESARRARSSRVWADGTATQFQEPMVVTPIHGFNPGLQPEFDSTTIRASVSLDYSILDGGSLRGRIDSADAAADGAAEALSSVRQSVALQTAATFVNILTLTRSREAQDQRLEALHEEERRVHQLLDVGRAAEVDRLRVEAAVASAEAERTTTLSQLEAAERSLARLTSLPITQTRANRLADITPLNQPLENREAILDRAVNANPAVQMALQEALSRKGSIVVADAVLRPKLSFVASWNDFGSSELSFTNEWQAGLQLRVPLYDGGTATKQVAAATAAWRAAEERVRSVRLELEESLDQVLTRIDETSASIESLTRAVNRYAEVTRVEKLRLELGAGTQADYLRAEADLVSARTGLASTHYRQIIHRIELARLTGDLDGAWLKQQVRNDS